MNRLPEIDSNKSDNELERKVRGEEHELTPSSNTSAISSSCDNGIEESSSGVSQSQLIASDDQEVNADLRSYSPLSLENGKKYETMAWTDLATEVREASRRLGYTQEMWDESKEPEVSKKYWADLDSEEKEAAMVLGYNETKWNFGFKDITPDDYDDMYWNQLPKPIRKAYRVLGYNKRLWNDDEAPASFDKEWNELAEAEQRAASIVGFRAETWDDDSIDAQPMGTTEESIIFLRGACYILLECISTAAFSGCIKMVFSVGKQILNKNALNAFKIVIGLAMMQFSGETHKWANGEEETMMRGRSQQPTLFRSILNLFSWWTIFAGVEHFVSAFENEMLYKYAETQWYFNLCELEDNVNITCQELFSNVTAPETMTCSNIQLPKYIEFIDMIEDYLVDSACGLLDDDREAMGPVYYWVLFIVSAVSMWYMFDDNFLRGCDTD
ncbi:MAG: hypothetical protein SGBAC_010684 [Bacillariaceae sp.]